MKRINILAIVIIMSVALCSCAHKNDATVKTKEVTIESISDEQAVEAIRNYCFTMNPDLESIAAEDYPVYWEIVSSEDSEIVVLFRSYTGAQVRYYIDRATGDTNVTEFVPGITEEEEPTDENFNVKDYI